MPFVCSTTRICDDLRLSRQTVLTARKHLAERKLISFIEGKSRHVPSIYSILECTDDQTDSLTHDLTPIKDKDIYQNKVFLKRKGVRFLTVKKEEKMESVKEKRIVDLVRFLQKERIMKGRFRLPMTEDRAYAYLCIVLI